MQSPADASGKWKWKRNRNLDLQGAGKVFLSRVSDVRTSRLSPENRYGYRKVTVCQELKKKDGEIQNQTDDGHAGGPSF